MGLSIDIRAIFHPNAQEINLITRMGAEQKPLSVPKCPLLAESGPLILQILELLNFRFGEMRTSANEADPSASTACSAAHLFAW